MDLFSNHSLALIAGTAERVNLALLLFFFSDVHKLLKATKVESMYYMTDWFMCIFIRTLPWNTVLRVFDLFLSEGVKVGFSI